MKKAQLYRLVRKDGLGYRFIGIVTKAEAETWIKLNQGYFILSL